MSSSHKKLNKGNKTAVEVNQEGKNDLSSEFLENSSKVFFIPRHSKEKLNTLYEVTFRD